MGDDEAISSKAPPDSTATDRNSRTREAIRAEEEGLMYETRDVCVYETRTYILKPLFAIIILVVQKSSFVFIF